MYYAHSTSDVSGADWQLLPEHLEGVASLAEQYAGRFGLGRAARLAGLLHDLGKFDPAFQSYISGRGASVDHSTAGAAIVMGLARSPFDRLMAELVAYVVAGHHAGLPDKHGGGGGTLSSRIERFGEGRLDPAWMQQIRPDASDLLPDFVRGGTDKGRIPFQFGVLGRMLFSCLVDAGAWIETRGSARG
jgi:CRISPR-associated endonuclease/helicase Cas3